MPECCVGLASQTPIRSTLKTCTKMNSSDPNVNAFLAELGQLSYKYKITIHGCGCCSSPYLVSDQELKEGTYWTDGSDGNITYSNENPFWQRPPTPEEEKQKQQKKQQEQDDVVMYAKWKIRQLEAKDAIRGDGL